MPDNEPYDPNKDPDLNQPVTNGGDTYDPTKDEDLYPEAKIIENKPPDVSIEQSVRKAYEVAKEKNPHIVDFEDWARSIAQISGVSPGVFALKAYLSKGPYGQNLQYERARQKIAEEQHPSISSAASTIEALATGALIPGIQSLPGLFGVGARIGADMALQSADDAAKNKSHAEIIENAKNTGLISGSSEFILRGALPLAKKSETLRKVYDWAKQKSDKAINRAFRGGRSTSYRKALGENKFEYFREQRTKSTPIERAASEMMIADESGPATLTLFSNIDDISKNVVNKMDYWGKKTGDIRKLVSVKPDGSPNLIPPKKIADRVAAYATKTMDESILGGKLRIPEKYGQTIRDELTGEVYKIPYVTGVSQETLPQHLPRMYQYFSDEITKILQKGPQTPEQLQKQIDDVFTWKKIPESDKALSNKDAVRSINRAFASLIDDAVKSKDAEIPGIFNDYLKAKQKYQTFLDISEESTKTFSTELAKKSAAGGNIYQKTGPFGMRIPMLSSMIDASNRISNNAMAKTAYGIKQWLERDPKLIKQMDRAIKNTSWRQANVDFTIAHFMAMRDDEYRDTVTRLLSNTPMIGEDGNQEFIISDPKLIDIERQRITDDKKMNSIEKSKILSEMNENGFYKYHPPTFKKLRMMPVDLNPFDNTNDSVE